MALEQLDDQSLIEQFDTSKMFDVICDTPHYLKKAFDNAITNMQPINNINSVVFFGLGGSAIAGELTTHKLFKHSQVPMQVIRGNSLPKFVKKDTLCIALSYSGNTKETLACFEEALKRGAKIIVITSGGKLEGLAKKNNLSLIKITSGFQPRAALGFLVGSSLGCLAKTNISSIDYEKIVNNTTNLLESLKDKYKPDIPLEKNLAKNIACGVFGKIPHIYASENIGLSTANRWKAQFNENAQIMAFCNSFPELAHNEIMSEHHIDSVIVYLKDPDERADKLIANSIALRLMESDKAKLIEIASEGESRLEKMLSIIFLGDFVSTYLALLKRIDPTPVERIMRLKKEVSKKIAAKKLSTDTIES